MSDIVKLKYSVYNEVWVIIKKGDTDIGGIYIDKSEAERDCLERQEELKSFQYLSHLKYIVVTLDDAITMIKDEIRDEYSSHGNAGY